MGSALTRLSATATLAVTLPAGLLGPVAIAACAIAIGVPVWIAWWWPAWPRIGVRGGRG